MQGFIRVPKSFEEYILKCSQEMQNRFHCDYCNASIQEGKYFTSFLVPQKKFCSMGCVDDFEDDTTGEHK